MRNKKKRCCCCKEEKPISAFCKDKNRPDGIHATCRTCRSRVDKARYHRDKGKKDKEKHLRRVYGITLDDYNVLWKKQRGVCEICGNPAKNKSLAVDHDHKTGEIRGLLCVQCNTLLGRVERNSDLIPNILKYLKK